MSQAIQKHCACPTPEVVAVPGSPGTNGNDGQPGKNAFTVTTADFLVPAINDVVTIAVIDNSWILNGQIVAIAGAGNSGNPGFFSVSGKLGTTTVTLTYLNYPENTASGNNIGAGAGVSPSANQPSFAAFGNDVTKHNAETIGYSVTNVLTTVSGMAITALANGLYLLLARLSVDMRGVTFSASRIITAQVVNVTQATTIASTTRTTGQPTTFDFPSLDFVLPFTTSNLTAGDVLELQIGLDTAQDAGTVEVNSASLCIVPLKLT